MPVPIRQLDPGRLLIRGFVLGKVCCTASPMPTDTLPTDVQYLVVLKEWLSMALACPYSLAGEYKWENCIVAFSCVLFEKKHTDPIGKILPNGHFPRSLVRFPRLGVLDRRCRSRPAAQRRRVRKSEFQLCARRVRSEEVTLSTRRGAFA